MSNRPVPNLEREARGQQLPQLMSRTLAVELLEGNRRLTEEFALACDRLEQESQQRDVLEERNRSLTEYVEELRDSISRLGEENERLDQELLENFQEIQQKDLRLVELTHENCRLKEEERRLYQIAEEYDEGNIDLGSLIFHLSERTYRRQRDSHRLRHETKQRQRRARSSLDGDIESGPGSPSQHAGEDLPPRSEHPRTSETASQSDLFQPSSPPKAPSQHARQDFSQHSERPRTPEPASQPELFQPSRPAESVEVDMECSWLGTLLPRGSYPILIDGVGGTVSAPGGAWTFVYANDPGGQRVPSNSGSNRYRHCRGMLEKKPGHETSNIRAALFAAVQVLGRRNEIFPDGVPRVLLLITSHEYIFQGQSFVEDWEGRGWLTTKGTTAKNRDLWKLFLDERRSCSDDGVQVQFDFMDRKQHDPRSEICRSIAWEEHDAPREAQAEAQNDL